MSVNSIISCGTDILLALFAVYLFFYYFDIFLIRKKRRALLSYFMEMSDAAIARKMNLVRSTVHEHRTRSLELLKQIMEENKSECEK